jgi:hypothetical protein
MEGTSKMQEQFLSDRKGWMPDKKLIVETG